MTNEEILNGFVSVFGQGGSIRGYMGPGRVNLIGEHIDYNGGHVFPCAITRGNYLVCRKRDDRKLRFYSANFAKGGIIESTIDDLVFYKKAFWTNYPKGVMWAFAKNGLNMKCGLDIYFKGDIPGSGLSSSAAMEVAIAVMLRDMFDLEVTDTSIAIMTQFSENKFNGMNCGIMDQFSSIMGKKNHAIFLDCASLEYKYVPLELGDYSIVVTNSNKPHSLTASHYNDRRKECEMALADIKKIRNISNLCQLSPKEFADICSVIKNPIAKGRARFAVYEEDRTKAAVEALEKNDILTFGDLLNQSGDGLRYEYEATCDEIDVLVDTARAQKGCIGSRETGGGWGGNTVSIVKTENLAEFKENVGKIYSEKTGLKADFNILEAGDGGRRLF
ncbi:MAG: galactokinase [Bacilli bacterium]